MVPRRGGGGDSRSGWLKSALAEECVSAVRPTSYRSPRARSKLGLHEKCEVLVTPNLFRKFVSEVKKVLVSP